MSHETNRTIVDQGGKGLKSWLACGMLMLLIVIFWKGICWKKVDAHGWHKVTLSSTFTSVEFSEVPQIPNSFTSTWVSFGCCLLCIPNLQLPRLERLFGLLIEWVEAFSLLCYMIFLGGLELLWDGHGLYRIRSCINSTVGSKTIYSPFNLSSRKPFKIPSLKRTGT